MSRGRQWNGPVDGTFVRNLPLVRQETRGPAVLVPLACGGSSFLRALNSNWVAGAMRARPEVYRAQATRTRKLAERAKEKAIKANLLEVAARYD